jgi:hypothetical protein
MVVADRAGFAARLPLVELGATGVRFGIQPPIAPLPRTAVWVIVADTGPLGQATDRRVALAEPTLVVETAGLSHRGGRRR